MANDQNKTGDWDEVLLGGEEGPKTDVAKKGWQGSVLLVDDDPLIIRMYQNKLTKDGFHVNTAFHGEEALAQVKREKPNIILLDVMMPKMNGVETLKALKADEATSDIPVIILTNLGDKEEDIENAKKLGAVDYLVKSEISLKDLSEKIKNILTQ